MRLYILVFLLYSFSSFSQKIHKIYLTSKTEDDKLKKTQAIIPVYKYVNNKIEPYFNFGTDNDKKLQKINIIKMPDMKGMTDTAYTFIYFSGTDNKQNSPYLISIIGNYKRSRLPIYFFTDKNNNLDFTDDGNPDIMPFGSDTLIIKLKNSKIENSEYDVKLSRIIPGKNMGYKNLLEEHYKKHSGTKKFTRINNCYREQRYIVRSADFKNLSDSFTICVKDMNVNALFNDNVQDQIYVGPYKQPIISEDLIEYKKGRKKTIFEWNEKKYYISNIDELGHWVEITELKDQKTYRKLKKHRKVPKFKFTTEMNEHYTLKNFKRKNIYLYFWNDDLYSLAQDTIYLRKIQLEYGNKIQVIGMNYGDEPKSMRWFQQYYKIPWIIGMSNRQINKKYYVENLPKGFWIGKRRWLKARNITPKEMYENAVKKFGK
ncbi:MAG: hypothetical protein IT243_02190 [Bacteroidia bacterium]|nr:hypothetical protein [Bacteroidia bacterium]